MTREEAIQELKSLEYYGRPFDNSETEDKKGEALFMAIKALEQARWIPCSEKLPDKNERLALLYDNGLVSGGKYLGERIYDVDFPDQNKKTKVIAWMPLPQPYKAESEEES